MNVNVCPSNIRGQVRAIASKSDAHRKLICAALADKPTFIEMDGVISKDIEATAQCLSALGADIENDAGVICVSPIKELAESPLLDCGESGSTLRFLLPVAAAVGSGARFIGCGRLPQRPLGELVGAMRGAGVSFSSERLPFEISGALRAGPFRLPGDVSSQYITGLLLALPCLDGDSAIGLTSPLESGGYVDMTVSALETFGASVSRDADGWQIKGGQSYRSPGRVRAEGDWSAAAFFLCAGALSGDVCVTGLDMASRQGDRAVVNILRRMGADVTVEEDAVTVRQSSLRGCDIDVRDTPDLLPVLAVTAAFAGGATRFTGAARLRAKESDRLAASAGLIRSLGGRTEEQPDGLTVFGGGLNGGKCSGYGDHRMVMSAAVAALACRGEVEISGAESVNKSYPGFFDDFELLGAELRR